MRSYFDNGVQGQSKYAKLVEQVKTMIDSGALASGMSGEVASFESWDNPATAATLNAQLNGNATKLSAILTAQLGTQSFVSMEGFEEGNFVSSSHPTQNWIEKSQEQAGIRAAAITMEAAADPVAYRAGFVKSAEAFEKQFATRHADYVADYTGGDRAAALGIMDSKMAFEAFENNNLASSMNYSVIYNLVAAVQEPALEAAFKTIVMAPDQVCFFTEIQLDRFWNGHKHTTENAKRVERNFIKYNLMEAIRRPSILRQDVLNIVPFYRETGPDAEHYKSLFMPEAIAKPTPRVVASATVLTQPLVVGKEYDLLDISAHPDLLNGGVFDETDTIDSNLSLDTVIIGVKGKADNNTDVPANHIEFPVRFLERANFIKSVQGHGNDMDLNFRSTELVLDEKSISMDGAAIPPAIKGAIEAGYRFRLEISAVGSANVESAYLSIQHAKVRIIDAYRVTKKLDSVIVDKVDLFADETKNPLTKAVKAEIAKLEFELKYFTIYGNRTNRNLRSQGFTVDTDVYTAKIAIGVRSPVRLQRPVGSEATYPTVDKLVQVTRTRQSADGWYEFFQYRDALAKYAHAEVNDPTRMSNMIGFGKFLIKPHYEHLRVNLKDLIKSDETRYNLENAREGLLAILQEAAARGIVKSEYNIASTMLNDGKQPKPHFVIITDNYLPLLLSARGDLRLLGENFGHTVVTTNIEEMDNKIFMIPAVPDKDGFSELRFGHCFMYPDLITTISPHNQNGAYKETVMVSPRYQHVPQLPFMVEIDVLGVKEFMTSYNKYRVLMETVEKGDASAPMEVMTETTSLHAPVANGAGPQAGLPEKPVVPSNV